MRQPVGSAPPEAIEKLANQIKLLRSLLKCSQPEFARRLGISLRAYINYERGDRKPGAGTLQALARIAERHGHKDMEATFDSAFKRLLDRRSTPVTEDERAWVRIVILLIRKNTFSTQITQAIIKTLQDLIMKPEPGATARDVEAALKEAQYYAAGTTEQKLEVLVDQLMIEKGISRAQAYAAIAYERPNLYAQVFEEAKAMCVSREVHESRTQLNDGVEPSPPSKKTRKPKAKH